MSTSELTMLWWFMGYTIRDSKKNEEVKSEIKTAFAVDNLRERRLE